MKRCIFIVEDKLADISGCLLTLQTILNAGLKDRQEEWRDIWLCLFHVCEDGKTQEDYKDRFQKAFQHSRDIMKENGMSFLSGADYIAVPLGQDPYDSCGVDILVDKIIGEQKTYLKRHSFTAEFVRKFPHASGDDAAYVLLLDIILALRDNVDQERIQNREHILSSCLYTRFPKEHCITYTNYSDYYGDKWVALAGVPSEEVPIERERMTRARAIYTPLKHRLYKALGL